MRVMMYHGAGPDRALICFGQIVARDPFLLAHRQPNPGFRFACLRGQRLAVARAVPAGSTDSSIEGDHLSATVTDLNPDDGDEGTNLLLNFELLSFLADSVTVSLTPLEEPGGELGGLPAATRVGTPAAIRAATPMASSA